MAGYEGQRPKKVSDAKVERTYHALEELLICEDIQQFLSGTDIAYLVISKRVLGEELSERGKI